MEAEPALVGGPRGLLVLRVDLDEAGVEIQHHRVLARGQLRAAPNPCPDLGHAVLQPSQRCLIEVGAEGPIQRRVRADVPEQLLLDPQVLDVRAVLPATRQHEHRLHQDLAAVMQRGAFAGDPDAGRERISQPELIGEGAERVQPDVGDDLPASGFHHHATGAGSVHLGSALLCWVPGCSPTPVSLTRRAFSRLSDVNSRGPVNDRG
jgi:hypothetical protein